MSSSSWLSFGAIHGATIAFAYPMCPITAACNQHVRGHKETEDAHHCYIDQSGLVLITLTKVLSTTNVTGKWDVVYLL